MQICKPSPDFAGGPALTSDDFVVLLAQLGPVRAGRVAVAVSGGRDSMALLLLADIWAHRHNKGLIALTIDHGLRPDSRREAMQVADWCCARRIAHRILPVQGDWRPGQIQARAREKRYQALAAFCEPHAIDTVFVAHHAQDQAETMIMRDRRPGQGIRGRAGMSAVQPMGPIRILRPLLGVARARLEAVLARQGQSWIEDPGNSDSRFERARLRRQAVTGPDRKERARRYAQRRALDDSVTDLLAASAVLTPWGSVHLDITPFQAAAEAVRIEALGRCLMAVSHHSYAPKRAKRLAALAVLGTRPLTLGNCLLVPAAQGVRVIQEPLRHGVDPIRSPARSEKMTLWRGKWRIDAPADALLKPLGQGAARRWVSGLASRKAALKPLWQELASLPAIWRDGAVCHAPVLDPLERAGLGYHACAGQSDPGGQSGETGLRLQLLAGPGLYPAPFLPEPRLDGSPCAIVNTA